MVSVAATGEMVHRGCHVFLRAAKIVPPWPAGRGARYCGPDGKTKNRTGVLNHYPGYGDTRGKDRSLARNGSTETVITAALLARIATGDRDAFRQLYDAIYQGLYRFIMRVIGDQHLAEDVTNETLMDVWRQAGRYRGAAQPRTWIYSIGHNKAVSALRKRREGALDSNAAERIEDPGPTPCGAASDSSRSIGLPARSPWAHRLRRRVKWSTHRTCSWPTQPPYPAYRRSPSP